MHRWKPLAGGAQHGTERLPICRYLFVPFSTEQRYYQLAQGLPVSTPAWEWVTSDKANEVSIIYLPWERRENQSRENLSVTAGLDTLFKAANGRQTPPSSLLLSLVLTEPWTVWDFFVCFVLFFSISFSNKHPVVLLEWQLGSKEENTLKWLSHLRPVNIFSSVVFYCGELSCSLESVE